MWHSALSARACGRTLAQPAMRLLGKMVLETFEEIKAARGGQGLPSAFGYLWRSIKLYREEPQVDDHSAGRMLLTYADVF